MGKWDIKTVSRNGTTAANSLNYWLLTTEYPPCHGGGISTYCAHTAQLLTSVGCSVTVVVPDDSINKYKPDTVNGITIVRFNVNQLVAGLSLGHTARLSYAFYLMVQSWIEEKGKPDVIEAQDYLGIAYYLTQCKHQGYAFLQDVPVIITLHSPAFIYLEYNHVATYRFPDFWTGEMEKQSMMAADLIIAPSRFIVNEIGKHIDISKKKIEFVANPFPVNDAGSIPVSFIRNKIVYYGKLSPQKGTFQLLAFFKKLWNASFPYPLHIIGGTDIVYHPEMQTMGQWVGQHYKDEINSGLLQLHGKIYPSEMVRSLNDAHVVVVPSTIDNLPYVIMEAMSLGKVVLASQQGGQREMIEHGSTGFLFDHDQPDSFGTTLSYILSLSDQAVAKIGEAARHYVKNNYSCETIAAQKSAAITALVTGHTVSSVFPFTHQEEIRPMDAIDCQHRLLSVVIPYYNMGDYLSSAVESVIQSTWNQTEIIIIDDGSTDASSIKRLEDFAHLKQVRIIRQQNSGLARTRNEGARLARGEYLAFLDADDQVAATYYEKAIHVLQQKSNVYFVGSWVTYFEDSEKVWPTFTPQPPYALVHNPVNSSGLVYKRAAFMKGGWNDVRLEYGLEDYESVVNMLHHGYNGVVLPEPLFRYRVRSGSMFRHMTSVKLLNANRYIAEKHNDYYTRYALELIHLLNANGPGYLFDNPTITVQVTTTPEYDNAVLSKMKSFIKKNEPLKRIALAIKKLTPAV